MEVKQEEMTQAVWDEWTATLRDQECAECGSHLTIRTVPARAAMALGCAADPAHTGFRQRTSATEDYRRGVNVHPVIQANIESRMMTGTEFNRAVQLLARRFPDSIKDLAGAALFINDCLRLGLDPLIQPAEAVPVVFHRKDKQGHEKDTVAMLITEDGYLSMAARACPGEYDGAPATMPLLDYLISTYKERPLTELDVMAGRTAGNLCTDEKAWVWVALGKRRSAATVNPVYGYYTHAEYEDARAKKLPAARQPGNQARVRAIKHWARETFPEARQRMLEYYAEVTRRSDGAVQAQQIIDAEYHLLPDTPRPHAALPGPAPAGNELARTATKHEPARTPKTARTQHHKQDDNKVGELAKRSVDKGATGGPGGDSNPPAAPSGAGEHTLLSSQQSPEMVKSREAAAAGQGFSIPLDWLIQTLKKIKWSDGTARSWLDSVFHIDTTGELKDVLPRLSRAQAEQFTRFIQDRADKLESQHTLL